ncbi:hypothetical protein F2Q65_09350 [Thiohalocapsa marina]|uniref:Uncharacterized protein n=1 Tax=Thiohalocapsa marina TaxID=424902 RepID=A0A5M8FRB4_9GAMM|nr:hypothetical protein [Thiohalocapsa marina]KAA6185295.1 hypothetical protein F2Q65_09350 [Thiohalocapsa marina]
MLTLDNDRLCFAFPEVHRHAHCAIECLRTLRLPDDNQTYPLPPKLGRFPMQAVDDYPDQAPPDWQRHGGVFLPIYQSEALWIGLYSAAQAMQRFTNRDPDGPRYTYPFAVKIATGKINAISGTPWQDNLQAAPQDYVVLPDQRWLDGYNVAKGLVRQFVASPLGSGHGVEVQASGATTHGGLQLAVYPMKTDAYAAYCQQRAEREANWLREAQAASIRYGIDKANQVELAAGGLIRQDIIKDPHGLDVWDQSRVSRCFVHLLNAEHYQAVTGERPPHPPFRARDYAKAGLPWFHLDSDGEALEGAAPLAKIQSIAAVTVAQTGQPMPDNDPLGPLPVRQIGGKPVRQGEL